MALDFRSRLKAGDLVLGTMVMYVRTPGVVRMAAAAGLDYLLIDLQHSVLGLETVADMCDVARAAGIAAIVRPSSATPDTVNRIQDLGATGLMFPDVASRAQVEAATSAMHYPPNGIRGVSIGGPAADYRSTPVDAEALRALDEKQTVIIQIERPEGLDAMESIVAGGGIDVVELGRQDLSLALGVPGQTRHRLVEAALDRALEVCGAAGVTVGLAAGSLEEGEQLAARGVRFITWRTDKAILLDSYKGFASAMASAGKAH